MSVRAVHRERAACALALVALAASACGGGEDARALAPGEQGGEPARDERTVPATPEESAEAGSRPREPATVPPEDAVRARPAWGGEWPSSSGRWRAVEQRTRGIEARFALSRDEHGTAGADDDGAGDDGASEDGEGAPAPIELRDPEGCIELAVIEDGEAGELFVAQSCPRARGVVVRAFTIATHEPRWIARAEGLALPGRTTRDASSAIAIDGAVVRVWGAEAEGQWVVTLDRATGRELDARAAPDTHDES